MKLAATERPKGKKGLSVEQRRDIARMDGRSVRFENRAFSKQKELAPSAGQKGGRNPRARRGEPSYSVAASSRALVRVGLAVLQQKKTRSRRPGFSSARIAVDQVGPRRDTLHSAHVIRALPHPLAL